MTTLTVEYIIKSENPRMKNENQKSMVYEGILNFNGHSSLSLEVTDALKKETILSEWFWITEILLKAVTCLHVYCFYELFHNFLENF